MKKYKIVYADPPWRYGFSKDKARGIETKYNTMSLEDIKEMKIPTDENALLVLWTTAPKLEEAFEVIRAWGFKYKTNGVWDKKKIGMGYWFRGRHEHLLIATKGKFSPPKPSELIASVFEYGRGKHSKKPHAIKELLNKWYPNELKLELFARVGEGLFDENDCVGWDVFGNQAENSIRLPQTKVMTT